MSLNIKNPETTRLARELAAKTGESLTTAVTIAVRERLRRVRGDGPTAERIIALGRDTARRIPADLKPDYGEWLYDEDGLPK
jgi:antitoxin VapB